MAGFAADLPEVKMDDIVCMRRYKKRMGESAERGRSIYDMKKLMMNGKKILAVLTLMVMVVCAAAPAVQAADGINATGSRKHASDGYYSYTVATGYRGSGLNMAAGAEYFGQWGFGYGNPTAKASSPKSGGAGVAYHAYGVNTVDFDTKWDQN